MELTRKWCMRMKIRGDLRFLSHAQTMRAVIQTAIRAGLPLKYTGGYNPRPVVSLVCPRPVGVSSRCDLVVMSLNGDMESDRLLDMMNHGLPQGMTFTQAEVPGGRRTPRPRSAEYEMELDDEIRPNVESAVEKLHRRQEWSVERIVSSKGRGRRRTTRRIDLKAMVKELEVVNGRLKMTLAPRGDLWARPGEVLELIGMDGRADLAGVERTAVEYEF